MKNPKYLTIGDLASIMSLILILKALSIVLKGSLCINRKVDFEKLKDDFSQFNFSFFSTKNHYFLIRY